MTRFAPTMFVLLVTLACTACPATVQELCHDTVCGIPIPPGCDPAADTDAASACVVDSFGAFVDGEKGDDGAAGTRAAPFKTIGKALVSLAGKSRVYVCEGSYPEHVVIDGSVSLYGGFSCDGWGYSGKRAKVAPDDDATALVIMHATSPIVLADLELVARDVTMPSKSSVTVLAKANTAPVTMRRLTARAGNAFAAAPSTETTLPNLLLGSQADPSRGNAAVGLNGGPEKTCTCTLFGTSVGGAGGSGANGVASATKGNDGRADPASPVTKGMAADGHGGATSTTAVCDVGGDGNDGSTGIAGAGATVLGTLAEDGWHAAPGDKGGPGRPGGGGGGGGGGNNQGGGGGGCGGCGGAGGAGGAGGGSSFALLVLDTDLTLVACTLGSGTAEPGADGAAAGAASLGGSPGAGSCNGGEGGTGAGGSGGGGGGGGSSVGIMYRGPAPKLDTATTIEVAPSGGAGGRAGAAGKVAGSGSPGASGTEGVSGIAETMHAL